MRKIFNFSQTEKKKKFSFPKKKKKTCVCARDCMQEGWKYETGNGPAINKIEELYNICL